MTRILLCLRDWGILTEGNDDDDDGFGDYDEPEEGVANAVIVAQFTDE